MSLSGFREDSGLGTSRSGPRCPRGSRNPGFRAVTLGVVGVERSPWGLRRRMGRPGPRRRCVAKFEPQRPFTGGSATMGDVAVLIGVGRYLFFLVILFSGLLHSDGEEGRRPEAGRCAGFRRSPRGFHSIDGFRKHLWEQGRMVGTHRGPPNVRAVPRFLCAPSVLRLNQVCDLQRTSDLYGH